MLTQFHEAYIMPHAFLIHWKRYMEVENSQSDCKANVITSVSAGTEECHIYLFFKIHSSMFS